MTNFNQPDDIKSIIMKVMDGKSNNNLQELIDYRNVKEIYLQSIIPLYQAVAELHLERKISEEQFNLRVSSIMSLLQLIEDIISKDHTYKTTAIFLIEDKSPFFLKVIQGLLHSESVYPVTINASVPAHTIQQLITDYKADSLFIINSANKGELRVIPRLHKVRIRRFSYQKFEKLVASLLSNPDQSIKIYDLLCDENEP